MTAWAPTRQQFFDLGLPAESCTAVARTLSAVTLSGSSFTLDGHGFTDADLVRFVAEGTDSALPAPLSAAVLYEAAPSGDSLFQVRTVGGGVVTLTDVGSGVIAVVLDFLPRLDRMREFVARYVDDHATPYAPPFTNETVPPSLVRAACKILALDVANILRAASPAYSIDDVRKNAEDAQVFLDKMRDGKPLAVQPTDRTPAVAELGARSFRREPSRGWRSAGL